VPEEEAENSAKPPRKVRERFSKKSREIAGKIAEGSRKFAGKVTGARNKVFDVVSGEEIPMDSDDVEDILKIIREESEPEPAPEVKTSSLWENIGNASKRVEEQIHRDQATGQYWLNQIEDIFEKYLNAEQERDTRLMHSYLALLGELARRTKNTALQKFVADKLSDLLTGSDE